jgi:antitoxin YefM
MKMQTTNATELRKNMKLSLDKVSFDKETIIIHRAAAEDIVMMPISEWNSWVETNYLLSTENNRTHLAESINQLKTGETKEIDINSLW